MHVWVGSNIIGRIQRVSATLLAAQLRENLGIDAQPVSPRPFWFFTTTTQYNNGFRVPFQPPLRHEPTGSHIIHPSTWYKATSYSNPTRSWYLSPYDLHSTLMSTAQLREREQRREERYDNDRRRVECPSTIFLHSEHLNNEGYYREKGGVHASRLSMAAAVGYRRGLCLAS